MIFQYFSRPFSKTMEQLGKNISTWLKLFKNTYKHHAATAAGAAAAEIQRRELVEDAAGIAGNTTATVLNLLPFSNTGLGQRVVEAAAGYVSYRVTQALGGQHVADQAAEIDSNINPSIEPPQNPTVEEPSDAPVVAAPRGPTIVVLE